MNLNQILKQENIRIDEDQCNVIRYAAIDFENIESADKFYKHKGYFDTFESDIDDSEAVVSYSITKDSELLYERLTREDVYNFLYSLEMKYAEDTPSTELLDKRNEILRNEREKETRKINEKYQNFYNKYSKIMNDEKFKEFLKEVLIKHGVADLPVKYSITNTSTDSSMWHECLDYKEAQTYFTTEINQYKLNGIYVEFMWDRITFSLYPNANWSQYSIIKKKSSRKYKTEYHQ